jgi:hypothetical protein
MPIPESKAPAVASITHPNLESRDLGREADWSGLAPIDRLSQIDVLYQFSRRLDNGLLHRSFLSDEGASDTARAIPLGKDLTAKRASEIVRYDQLLVRAGIALLVVAFGMLGLALTTGYSFAGGCKNLILPALHCSVLVVLYPVSGFLAFFGVAFLAMGRYERRRAARAKANIS